MSRPARWLSLAAAGVGVYLAVLLARYFWPPHIPRFRVETFFIWFLALGFLAIAFRGPGPRGTTEREPRPVGPGADPVGPVALSFRLVAPAAVCYAAVALFLWGGAVRVGWLSDDFVLAGWAARREWVHAETGFLRPVVPMFWYLLSFVPLPLDIAAHAANLLLHAANASLVAVIGSRSGLSRTDALAAGLMFATCAGLSEAVVWASGAQDVLMTTLGLMALAAVLKRDPGGFAAADPPRPRFGPSRSGSIVPIVAVIASTVALGVKETAVVVPVLGWAAAWASPGGLEDKTRRRALWLMTAVSVAYVVLRALSGVDAEYGRGLSRYFAKQLMVDPFATLGEPWSAAWIQAHPAVSLVRALTLVTLVAGAFWWWRRDEACTRCAIAFGGWVLIAVLPVLSLFHVSATLEGSRYLYLPAAGFCLLVATLAGELARRTAPRAMLPLLAGILAIFIVPSAVAIRGEGARWTRAAQIRDRILDSANDIAAVPCGTIVTEGLVDNVEGAYVFRNGLTEALAAHGRSALFGNPSAVRCRLTWSDRLVVTRVEP